MQPKCKPIFILCLILILAGCSSKTISVTDNNEFLLMTERFATTLYEQHILDINGEYIEPIIPIAQTFLLSKNIGEILYTQLKPDFYYKMESSTRHISDIPTSFSNTKKPNDILKIYPYGFILKQKDEHIALQLLAITDWNNDGQKDYIILVRAKFTKTNNLYDHYIIIENTHETTLKAQLIGTHEYKKKLTKIHNPKNETETLEVKAGTRPIVLPRDNSKPKKNNLEKPLTE